MVRWVDEWLDGWMDGWMNGWMTKDNQESTIYQSEVCLGSVDFLQTGQRSKEHGDLLAVVVVVVVVP